MRLSQLIYYSKRKSYDPRVLEDILRSSRRNNEKLGITGALLVQDKYFFQLLEGPRDTLSELLSVIMKDERHEQLVLVLFEELNYRIFSNWRMAHLSDQDATVQKIYKFFTADISSPSMLPGFVAWAMIDQMSTEVLGGHKGDA
ncbi:MAG: BLUF domain-containing protein [Pseudomonadota bacterium]